EFEELFWLTSLRIKKLVVPSLRFLQSAFRRTKTVEFDVLENPLREWWEASNAGLVVTRDLGHVPFPRDEPTSARWALCVRLMRQRYCPCGGSRLCFVRLENVSAGKGFVGETANSAFYRG